MEIELAGEKLLLSKHKIVYWSKLQTVFIADLHLGKITRLRKSGIAVPMAIIKAEIDRIENIISKFRPKRIFFLGDLFHSDLNHEWNIFNDFLQQYPTIEFILLKLNHGGLNICGHIHPEISIKGNGRSYLTLPCFYLKDNQLILQAFGRFTGLAKTKPKKGSNSFAVLNESVKKFGWKSDYQITNSILACKKYQAFTFEYS
ncbi:MAG: hypothetical protein ACQETL_02895 [Bacteroidota bacterium]